MRLLIFAEMPGELDQAWMQHLRDFDLAHPGCTFRIASNCPDLSLDEVIAMLNKIDPPLPLIKVVSEGRKQ